MKLEKSIRIIKISIIGIEMNSFLFDVRLHDK